MYFRDKGVNFFTGVPDSLLKDFASCIDDTTPAEVRSTLVQLTVVSHMNCSLRITS
jgi:hypothetical protein